MRGSYNNSDVCCNCGSDSTTLQWTHNYWREEGKQLSYCKDCYEVEFEKYATNALNNKMHNYLMNDSMNFDDIIRYQFSWGFTAYTRGQESAPGFCDLCRHSKAILSHKYWGGNDVPTLSCYECAKVKLSEWNTLNEIA